jgi:hypothetical protein
MLKTADLVKMIFEPHEAAGIVARFHVPSTSRCIRTAMAFCVVSLLAACATSGPASKATQPDAIRAATARLLPDQISDRAGWARDIQVAFTAQDLAPTRENLCAVIAVTEQESSFQANPAIPGLPRIARAEIDRRADSHHIPAFLVDAALGLRSSTGQTYAQRLGTVRTEAGLSAIFDDFIGMAPLGRQLFGGFNPVHTAGPMQVSVAFAEAHARDYPYPITGSLRDEVFSRRGGMFFGTAHLLGYKVNYDRPLYRFADFNAGRYASRNAAFQNAVSRASGIALALDGDLIVPDSNAVGSTELAVRALGKRLDMDNTAIRRALELGDTFEFEQTPLYQRVFRMAGGQDGKPLPRAVLPGIKLESPKITRALTTAWFANRVQERWQRCMARAGGG